MISRVMKILLTDPTLFFDSVSIEFLPGAADIWLTSDTHGDKLFLLQERNLGIPQKTVYAAYRQAIAAFRPRPPNFLEFQENDVDSAGNLLVSDLLSSSAVLLLANPAHQTALNTRKRLIIAGLRDPRTELLFSAGLLTLRECSKQTIIWHHRRWLLRYIAGPIHRPDSKKALSRLLLTDEDALHTYDISISLLHTEFDVALQASETYRRNYFAWSHRGRVFDALLYRTRKALDKASSDGDGLVKLLREEHARVLQWIEQHVTDYTAMQYLCRIDALLRDMVPEVTVTPSHRHATSLLRTYPQYESVWMYARNDKASQNDAEVDAAGLLTKVSDTADQSIPEHREQLLLNARRCLVWYGRHDVSPLDLCISESCITDKGLFVIASFQDYAARCSS